MPPLSARESRYEKVSIMEAKRLRKNLETDAQNLHNRIKLLQLEEQRAKKRIQETRQRC